MPSINCVGCGEKTHIDGFATPYTGDIACSKCKVVMSVNVGTVGSGEGTFVKRKYQEFKDIKHWDKLKDIEQISLKEASLCLGEEAYTASELMSLRTLEGLLRRVYSTNETLGNLIQRMETDTRLTEFSKVFAHFKNVRNKLAHPDKISNKQDAESTFLMTKKLITDVLDKIP